MSVLAVLCAAALSLPGAGASASARQDDLGRLADHSSPYLHLGHWAYDYLNVLLARGRLDGLSITVQPYRRIDVLRALRRAEAGGRLSAAEGRWAARILDELSHDTGLLDDRGREALYFGVDLEAGLKGMTQTHRDPLRPEGEEKLFPTVALNVETSGPHLAAAFRIRWDNHYLNDPQFPQGRVVEPRACDPMTDTCAYRVENGYVEVQSSFVKLFLGRMQRNWGPLGARGFLVSDYPYSYDHVGYRFGGARLSLSGLFALPNDFRGDTVRYVSSHRLDWQVTRDFVLSLSESVVWGGENARFDLAYVNPVGVWEISASRGNRERNAMGVLEAWWRPADGVVTHGALLVDNTRVGDGGAEGFTQWGAALGVQLSEVTPSFGLRGEVSVLNSLAYRSRIGEFQYYTVDRIGLGRDVTDMVMASLRGDWFLPGAVVLQPELHVLWNGEDDIRAPWPPDAFTDYDLLLVGQVETTVRPALRGRAVIPHGDLEWDVGVNLIRNRDHVPGGWDGTLVADAEIGFRKRFSTRFSP